MIDSSATGGILWKEGLWRLRIASRPSYKGFCPAGDGPVHWVGKDAQGDVMRRLRRIEHRSWSKGVPFGLGVIGKPASFGQILARGASEGRRRRVSLRRRFGLVRGFPKRPSVVRGRGLPGWGVRRLRRRPRRPAARGDGGGGRLRRRPTCLKAKLPGRNRWAWLRRRSPARRSCRSSIRRRRNVPARGRGAAAGDIAGAGGGPGGDVP